MRISATLFGLASVLSAWISTASASSRVTVEKRSHHPPGWTLTSDLPSPDSRITLNFGLQQENLHNLDAVLLSVSDPESPSYGQHWSSEKVADFFAASETTFEAVKSWLAAEGITAGPRADKNSNWIKAQVSVKEAERLLGATYQTYKHHSGYKKIACSSYSVPHHVRKHLDLVTPTIHFDHPSSHPNSKVTTSSPEPRARSKRAPPPGKGYNKNKFGKVKFSNKGLHLGNHAANAKGGHAGPKLGPLGLTQTIALLGELTNCANVTTPSCLEQLYGYGDYKQTATSQNSLGIVEYTPQAYNGSDLDLFFGKYSPSQVGERPILQAIADGSVQTDPTLQGFEFNAESNLDLSYSMNVVNGLEVTLYQVGDVATGASPGNMLNGIDGSYCTSGGGNNFDFDATTYDPAQECGVAYRANVISTSYGYGEFDLSPAYEERQCAEYGKLGLEGTTFIFSSGDYGVASLFGIGCLDGNGAYSDTGTVFVPAFPPSCPYVTSVGATQVQTGGIADVIGVLLPEVACETVIFSGGGFSNVFPAPSWQAKALKTYYQHYDPGYTSDQYNNSQTVRGFPDLAANGANYPVFIQGVETLVYGSSASAPVFAGIVTLLNDARISVGKSPIGFINPSLYSKKFASTFNDITSGKNPGCGTEGFTAVPGWDPVTGLGTPNFQKLLPLFLALP